MTNSHWISRLCLSALLCGTFLTTPLKATGSDDEGEAGSKTPSAPMATTQLPSAIQMTIDGTTPGEGIHPPKSVPPALEMTVETKKLRTAKQILAKIALNNFHEGQGQSLVVLEEDLHNRTPADREAFDTFFGQFLGSLPLKIKNDKHVKTLLEQTIKSKKSNEDLLTLARDIKDAFPFLGHKDQDGTISAVKFFIGLNFSSEQIKAIGTLSFKRSTWGYNRNSGNDVVTASDRYLLDPDNNAALDFAICTLLLSKTPDEIRQTGQALSASLGSLTAWSSLDWSKVYDIANHLITLPPEGIREITDVIGRDKEYFKIHTKPVDLIKSKIEAWREANPVEEVDPPAGATTSSTTTPGASSSSTSSTSSTYSANPFLTPSTNPFGSPDSGEEPSKERRKKRRDKVDEVQAQVDEVKRIMVENPDRMLNNMQRAEDLEGRTADLTSAQRTFASRSANLRRDMRKKNTCIIQ